jgi:hypothetical protein
LRAGEVRGQAAEAVAGQFRGAAIGVPETHRGAAIARREEDEAIGADAEMTGAHGAGERCGVADQPVIGGKQEIVAVGVRLDETWQAHHGTLKAWNT